jgi:hypothetical protein
MAPANRIAVFEAQRRKSVPGVLKLGVQAAVDIAASDADFHDPLAVSLAPLNSCNA